MSLHWICIDEAMRAIMNNLRIIIILEQQRWVVDHESECRYGGSGKDISTYILGRNFYCCIYVMTQFPIADPFQNLLKPEPIRFKIVSIDLVWNWAEMSCKYWIIISQKLLHALLASFSASYLASFSASYLASYFYWVHSHCSLRTFISLYDKITKSFTSAAIPFLRRAFCVQTVSFSNYIVIISAPFLRSISKRIRCC